MLSRSTALPQWRLCLPCASGAERTTSVEDLSSSEHTADVLEKDDRGGLRHVQGLGIAGHGDVQAARVFEFGHTGGLATEDDRAAVEEIGLQKDVASHPFECG